MLLLRLPLLLLPLPFRAAASLLMLLSAGQVCACWQQDISMQLTQVIAWPVAVNEDCCDCVIK
jgi:hypothetical protein